MFEFEEVRGKRYRRVTKKFRLGSFIAMFTFLFIHMFVHFYGPVWLENLMWPLYMISMMVVVLDMYLNNRVGNAAHDAHMESMKQLMDTVDQAIEQRRLHYEN